MKPKLFTLNKANNFRRHFSINPENPFFKLYKIKARNSEDASLFTLTLKYEFKRKFFTETESLELTGFDTEGDSNILGEISLNSDCKSVDFFLDDFGSDEIPADISFDVYYTNERRFVNISGPSETFRRHLKNHINTRIFFSGSFGQGKTTFLDFFFEQNSHEYSVFKIFPVSYSVASNDDIFRYIKCDILFQLLDIVQFDKENVSYSESAKDFFKQNADKVLAKFLYMIPAIGKSVYDVFEKMNDLKEQYLKYHDNRQIDDAVLAADYISNLYNKDGGLFEDDFIPILSEPFCKKSKKKMIK